MTVWHRLRRWVAGISKTEVAALSVTMTLLASSLVVSSVWDIGTVDRLGAADQGGTGGDSAATDGTGPIDGTAVPSGSATPDGIGGSGAISGSGPSTPGRVGPPSSLTGPTSGPGSSPAPGAPLRATDQGVDSSQVKIGFVINNLGGLQASGQAQGQRDDVRQVIAAYVDYVNKTGGIAGRKVTPEIVEQDPLNPNTVQAACVELGEQKKVFGVVDPLSTAPCYALKYKLPHTTENLQRTQDLLKRAPYEASTFINIDRTDRNWVYGANDAGFFQTAYDGRPATFGLLAHANTEPGPGHVEQVLKPALRDIGVKIAAEYRITPNPARAASEMAQAVLAMKQANVTRMFLSVGFLDVTNFLNQAEAQEFRPKYFASDLGAHTQNFQAQNFNPKQWENTQAITSTHSGQSAAGKPISPATKQCSDILKAAGLPGIKDEGDLIGITYCDTFFLMVQAARNVGPELTRRAWGAALQGLGDFPSAYTARSNYRRDKFDGGDDVAYIRWRSSCRCWVQTSNFKRGFG